MVRPCAMRWRLSLTIDLALRVEGAGRFIKNQNARVVNQGARDRKPLSLAAGQVRRTFLDMGLVSVGHASR